MMTSCVARAQCAALPAALSGARRASPQRLQLTSRKLRLRCSASGNPEGQQQEQQPETPLKPPTPPTQAQPVDMAKAPNALGPVGNFFMATLLILLCGLSLLSTVGRQFQEDLVPLTQEQIQASQR
ncbi:hypothetical protein D9Q98_000663 [Chlorella vulgaris]|uniref:Uncharacterized protein n=1 Tax=Chlorella vulgaris TaxID=3077 RepID=A0A9D4TZP2_CHLVU|nr:hypothetical protein D9Q98_000663 [Chlorella vulgaris]